MLSHTHTHTIEYNITLRVADFIFEKNIFSGLTNDLNANVYVAV